EIMQDLRKGLFDVLIGVNLLREGLDLPEVSLVAILDADKEGFLRSARSLTQTVGRAARNIKGKAIMYADKVTDSMQKTIDETNYRRQKQMEYNEKNNLTPKPLNKKIEESVISNTSYIDKYSKERNILSQVAESERAYHAKVEYDKLIREKRKEMEKANNETNYRRQKQIEINEKNNLTPKPLNRKIEESVISNTSYIDKYSKERNILSQVAESEMAYHAKVDYHKLIREKRKEMEK